MAGRAGSIAQVSSRTEAGSGDKRGSRFTPRIWRPGPDHQKWPRTHASCDWGKVPPLAHGPVCRGSDRQAGGHELGGELLAARGLELAPKQRADLALPGADQIGEVGDVVAMPAQPRLQIVELRGEQGLDELRRGHRQVDGAGRGEVT